MGYTNNPFLKIRRRKPLKISARFVAALNEIRICFLTKTSEFFMLHGALWGYFKILCLDLQWEKYFRMYDQSQRQNSNPMPLEHEWEFWALQETSWHFFFAYVKVFFLTFIWVAQIPTWPGREVSACCSIHMTSKEARIYIVPLRILVCIHSKLSSSRFRR
jgi:hypothetical protein